MVTKACCTVRCLIRLESSNCQLGVARSLWAPLQAWERVWTWQSIQAGSLQPTPVTASPQDDFWGRRQRLCKGHWNGFAYATWQIWFLFVNKTFRHAGWSWYGCQRLHGTATWHSNYISLSLKEIKECMLRCSATFCVDTSHLPDVEPVFWEGTMPCGWVIVQWFYNWLVGLLQFRVCGTACCGQCCGADLSKRQWHTMQQQRSVVCQHGLRPWQPRTGFGWQRSASLPSCSTSAKFFQVHV